ncbi:hypothetical protein UPYG_G00140220 [Umbra pygmaea]|uniref:Uncharacterized protein n=1 Tax=Umbra pygmaea TaxID=75934 RepID=A0ABD0WV50_UMBPY
MSEPNAFGNSSWSVILITCTSLVHCSLQYMHVVTTGLYIFQEHSRTMVIDIRPGVNETTQGEKRVKKRFWEQTDNSFAFNFFPRGVETTQSDIKHQFERLQTKTSKEQGSGFQFNFQIPVTTPENMEKESDTAEAVAQKEPKEEKTQSLNTQQTPALNQTTKAKKKKKPDHKKKNTEDSEQQQKEMTNRIDTEEACGDNGEAMTAEQQLKRELDWCIEQLELGMMTQKATPKQKEDASRAIKTLRSSKAPLVKKRQVMRAMSGDYRKKMEEEKRKQFNLIQAAMTSAQVKAVADPTKKSLFHRKAGNKTDTLLSSDPKCQPETLQSQNLKSSVQNLDSSTFVFTPTKEQFCFNFL